jgi:hypothetical protein
MTARQVTVIAVIAGLAVGGAFWLASTRSGSGAAIERPLYPDLDDAIADVDRITIRGTGDEVAVSLARQGAQWQIAERRDYPADTAKLRRLVRSIVDALVIEQKTSRPESYPALGVEDLTASDAPGKRVVIEGATPAVDLIVGKTAQGNSGTYVRRAGEAQSLLVAPAIDVAAEPAEWIDATLIDIGADRIKSAAITIGDVRYEAAKQDRSDIDFAVTGVPKGRALSSAGAANGIATALAGLEADDVEQQGALDADAPSAEATFATFDGLELELDGYVVNANRYVTVEASAVDASGEDAEKIKQEAERIASRTRGWAYLVPTYKYEAIFRPVDDFLAPEADDEG